MLTERVGGMENTTNRRYSFTLAIDPSTLSTAQQKKVSFRQRRIFTNPRVARTKKAVALLARIHSPAVRAALNGVSAIRLEATYFYSYPKGTPKKRLIDDFPRTVGADCDNLSKAPIDALGYDHGHGANLWDDDRRISTLLIRKRYTTKEPRIEFSVMSDDMTPTI